MIYDSTIRPKSYSVKHPGPQLSASRGLPSFGDYLRHTYSSATVAPKGDLSCGLQVSRLACRLDVRFCENYALTGFCRRPASGRCIASPGFSCGFTERPSGHLTRDGQVSLRFASYVWNPSATRQVGPRTCRPHDMLELRPWKSITQASNRPDAIPARGY